jgi:aspartate racemase
MCKANGYNSPLLLATAGTIKSGIYEKFFKEKGIELIIPSQQDIDATMQVIYGREGVKAGFVDENNQNRLAEIARSYSQADCIILGCTELPLVAQKITAPTIDPMSAAANFLIMHSKYPQIT